VLFNLNTPLIGLIQLEVGEILSMINEFKDRSGMDRSNLMTLIRLLIIIVMLSQLLKERRAYYDPLRMHISLSFVD
jgi:hypothetical protein